MKFEIVFADKLVLQVRNTSVHEESGHLGLPRAVQTRTDKPK